MKYIFITGGVVSSLGKGMVAASLGYLLSQRKYKVSFQKINLSYNMKNRFLNPFEYGETYITKDGSPADLSLGHFERFVDIKLTKSSNITTGLIHERIAQKEEEGKYDGIAIKAIPHITDEIKLTIRECAQENNSDIHIVEIGGTVGDMEASVYLEAIRQFQWECGNNDCCYIHLALLPFLSAAKEIKTKPTQNSVKILRSIGIQPDIIVCRSQMPISRDIKDKIALFCNVKETNIIQDIDVSILSQLPMELEMEGLSYAVLNKLNLPYAVLDLSSTEKKINNYQNISKSIKIALVGEFTSAKDSYLSICESILYSCLHLGKKARVVLVNSENLVNEKATNEILQFADGIVIPGRHKGDILANIQHAIDYAKDNEIPTLITGNSTLQLIYNICNNNLENKYFHTINDLLTGYAPSNEKNIGEIEIEIHGGTLLKAYKKNNIVERLFDEYMFNSNVSDLLANGNLIKTAKTISNRNVVAFELNNYKFFLGTLFYPEFNSKLDKPNSLINYFINSIIQK